MRRADGEPSWVLDALLARLRPGQWPGIEGFVLVGPLRPMRVVLRGTLEGPTGPIEVAVKWQRPRTWGDHVARRARGAKGPREAAVLAHLATAGVRAPRPLAAAHEPDVLVTRWYDGLSPLPAAGAASNALVAQVARTLAEAHTAGLVAHDLHRGNLALDVDGEVVLVDLGRARIGRPPLVTTLARHAHALLGDARRTQRLRGLRTFLATLDPSTARARTHALAPQVEVEARELARAYRSGRDRRATRRGRHFEPLVAAEGRARVEGMRFLDAADAALGPWLVDCLAQGSDVGTPLKTGGTVRAATPPAGPPVVLKRFGPVARGRRSRAERAFVVSHALANRHVPAARGLAWCALGAGPSLAAFERIPGVDLAAALAPDGPWWQLDAKAQHAALARLGRALRHLHDADVRHRDLKLPNLVWQATAGSDRFFVVDLDGARRALRGVTWARRAKDLARLAASNPLGPVAAARVLRAYLAAGTQPAHASPRAFARRVARHVRAKRGPAGRPR